jgi:type IV pilus assembly protein PilM
LAGRDNLVGIDLGSHAVKVASVREAGGAIREIRYGERELPGDLSPEAPADWPALCAAVQSALAQAGIRTGRMVAALPRRQVTIRLVNLPQAEKEAMRRMLAFEAQQHVLLRPEEMVLDFQALGPVPQPAAPGGELVEVLLAGAKRSLVTAYLGLARELRFKLRALTIDALALFDLCRLAPEAATGSALALDLGASSTQIVGIEQGQLRLTHSVALGGDDLTRAFQQDLGLEPGGAEQSKREHGLDLFPNGPGPAVQAWLERLASEVRRSVVSFSERPVSELSAVYLTGGGSQLKGLADWLTAALGQRPRELRASEAFPQLEGNGREMPARFAAAAGLALRGTRRSATTIDLIPLEFTERRRQARRRLLRGGVLALAAAALVVLYFGATSSLAARQRELRSLRTQAEQARPRLEKERSLAQEGKRLQAQFEALEKPLYYRHAVLDLMKAVVERAPEGTWLDNLRFEQERSVMLRGHAPSVAAVADLQAALQQAKRVERVTLEQMQDEPRFSEVRFTMNLALKLSPPTARKVAEQERARASRARAQPGRRPAG